MKVYVHVAYAVYEVFSSNFSKSYVKVKLKNMFKDMEYLRIVQLPCLTFLTFLKESTHTCQFLGSTCKIKSIKVKTFCIDTSFLSNQDKNRCYTMINNAKRL